MPTYPMKGKLAFCSQGYLGLITDDYMHTVKFGVFGEIEHLAYVGVHLTGDKIGQPWCSRNPRVVGSIREGQPVQVHDSTTGDIINLHA